MSGRSKFPFTATQWQELEHQALIYKYMAAGMPIPPDLLFTVKRSLDSSLSSKFFPYQTSPIGWNPYQMGYGKKLDPEPGRCRRTDGKKWRCSKEAYPDSKYCERHMHRGKNRSRKPVEVLTTAAAAAATAPPPPSVGNSSSAISSITKNSSPANHTVHSLSSLPLPLPSDTSYDSHHHLLYPNSSSSRPPGIHLSAQDNTSHLLLDSAASFRDRYLHGLKEEVGEHSFFSESSGAMRGYAGSPMDEAWQLNTLKMGGAALNHPKQNSCSGLQSGYPYLELKSETSKQEKQNQQCYVWGRDFNCDLTMKVERENEPQKTIHHFFDEWPPKGRDSWHESSSTTQLSISIPTSSHDFFLSNSRTHNDG